VTPQEAAAEIEAGNARPAYVVAGEEGLLVERVVAAARAHVVDAATAGFNVDVFDASEGSIERALDAAKTAPMMARRRLVILRGVERLDKSSDDDAPKKGVKISPLDRLADYVASPAPSSCFMVVGQKLDARRRVVTIAKKQGFFVECAPLRPHALPGFVRDEAKRRGHAIAGEVAESIVDLVGAELGPLVDAVERLSLYVGAKQPITEEAVETCVARVRIGSVWGLADAVAAKDRATALRLLDENFDPKDRGLPLLGLLASSIRKTLKLRALLAAGVPAQDAAKQAGIPPFRAGEAAQQARRFGEGELERAVAVFAEVDMALKGSRRPPLLVLEEAIVRLT
jgi:DNA polymerase-3 subunit delta